MKLSHPLVTALLGLATAVPATAQVACTGPRTGLPTIGQKTNPPAQSGKFDQIYNGTFTVKRSGVYVIKGTVGIGRGAGAPVDFSWVTAKINGHVVIDEKPPPIQGAPPPPNGWTYTWSIYYWTLSKSFEVRMFLDENKSYSMALQGKGAYTVVTPYHRRNYGMSLGASATLCGPSAAVQLQGTGCVGAAAPTLRSPRTPVLGTRRDLVVQGRAAARGFVAFGLPTTSPLYLGAGCSVYVDLRLPYLLFPVTANGAGTAFVIFDVPPDPALAALRIATQGVLGNPASPVALDLSNGLILTLGY